MYDYLAHYGVKGQKWGVRNYQNEDGSLTAEGQARYGGSESHVDKGFLRKTAASESGQYAFGKWRERRDKKNLQKAQEKGNEKKIEKYQSKLDAQAAANRNLAAYREHTSTAKLLVQNVALNSIGLNANKYRKARAAGADRLQSLVESSNGLIGRMVRGSANKERYGKRIIWSDSDTNEYFGKDED